MGSLTITAKFKILPTDGQIHPLLATTKAIQQACNYASDVIFDQQCLVQSTLHKVTYRPLRELFCLRSQMAQSVLKTVIAKYKSAKSNGHPRTRIRFKKTEYDLVRNRDYSLTKDGLFSLNTLQGRVKVPFQIEHMEHFFDGAWKFGTAKLVYKKGKFYLHIPMTNEIADVDLTTIKNVIGVDFGINFTAVSFDSKDNTTFFHGRHIKNKRANYKQCRRSLQKRQTASSRRRLKKIGQRENRWMTNVNHCVSKALVEQAGTNSLFVLEALTGIRTATEKVLKRNRYETVSWTFYQLRHMIEYKAKMNESDVLVVDPKYTSQQCPKCGHIEKSNRNKKTHTFQCKTCSYTTNDDRIGAMNLRAKGIQYLNEVATQA
ncbi:transposase [Bacillaceae bacterium IKA-2]|nr:transposase [Bacillaceae bacterium IKA-2]